MKFSPFVFVLLAAHSAEAFQTPAHRSSSASSSVRTAHSQLSVLKKPSLDNTDTKQQQQRIVTIQHIPPSLRTQGQGIPSRKEKLQVLESRRYESQWLQQSEGDSLQGFDWEMEKRRRWVAGLRMCDDGNSPLRREGENDF